MVEAEVGQAIGMRLAGAHVLVTGASRGIGALVAERAAQRGASVTFVARSEEPLRALVDRVGGRALPVDLADPGQRRGLVRRAEDEAGQPVDVLVNTAGVDAVGAFLTVDEPTVADLFQVNLLAPAELCRQVVPGMVQRGRGHVVNVSSGFSTVVAPGVAAYCASKAGLSHFTGALRQELSGSGVATTLVELGPVRTVMFNDLLQDRLAGPAMRRLLRLHVTTQVDPDEVARQVCDGIEQDRAHVVLPKRMVPVVAMTWLPRRIAGLLLAGLPRR